jgi:2-phosphosulfolactate phosphatase
VPFARDEHQQRNHGIRFDWGLSGARALADEAGCTIVVDVLSFTTTVSIAVARGMAIYPFQWRDVSAHRFADSHAAELAVDRSELSAENPWSLSAASLLVAPFTSRLVLPSPNGSTISANAKGTVIAASLRNGRAVAHAVLADGFGTPQRPISVIAAGEQWTTDQSLRPCVEDLLGAGLVISTLMQSGLDCSEEATLTARAYETSSDVAGALTRCASGLELIADGFGADIAPAAEIHADVVVPVLHDGAFVAR